VRLPRPRPLVAGEGAAAEVDCCPRTTMTWRRRNGCGRREAEGEAAACEVRPWRPDAAAAGDGGRRHRCD